MNEWMSKLHAIVMSDESVDRRMSECLCTVCNSLRHHWRHQKTDQSKLDWSVIKSSAPESCKLVSRHSQSIGKQTHCFSDGTSTRSSANDTESCAFYLIALGHINQSLFKHIYIELNVVNKSELGAFNGKDRAGLKQLLLHWMLHIVSVKQWRRFTIQLSRCINGLVYRHALHFFSESLIDGWNRCPDSTDFDQFIV